MTQSQTESLQAAQRLIEAGYKDYEILVADDDATSSRLLQAILEASGFTVIGADSGRRCIREAENRHPDLIVLDIVLPDMNGFDVCRKLKESPSLRDIPVIFVTGLSDSHNIVKGFSVGGSDYITKPFQAAEVAARVCVHLKILAANRNLFERQKKAIAELKKTPVAENVEKPEVVDGKSSVYFEQGTAGRSDHFHILKLSDSTYSYLVANLAADDIDRGLFSAAVKTAFRENANILVHPGETLDRVTTLVSEFLHEHDVLSVGCIQINRKSKSATIVMSGELIVFLDGADGEVQGIGNAAQIGGIFDATIFKQTVLNCEPGDRFWVASPGVFGRFSDYDSTIEQVDKFRGLIKTSRRPGVSDSLSAVCDSLFLRRAVEDDRLVLAIEM